ncbi:MAG: endonuclease V [Thermoplasmata archaeon]|nr:endonuclease V [Thermoplasmata archaeon]
MRSQLSEIKELLKAFWEEVGKAILSLPPGGVVTYGDIARSLGDVSAARALPGVLEEIKRFGDPFTGKPLPLPTHRVVRSDGTVRDEQIELLKREGVEVREGRVDLKRHSTSIPRMRPVLNELKGLQRDIDRGGEEEVKFDSVLAVDVAYRERNARVCGVLFEKGGVELTFHHPPLFPYIPGYLFFREGVLIVMALREWGVSPSLILLDGHGLLHPRRAGLATHLGYFTQTPSIGVAKSLLTGKVKGVEEISPVYLDGEHLGWAVRKRVVAGRGEKHLYISPGWGVGVDDSLKIYLKVAKIAGGEPVEMAHRCTKRWR